MKPKNQIYRQGDVLVMRVDSIPKGGKKVERDNGRIVLAYGEVTGHAHAIAEEEVTMLEVDGGIRYLDVQMEAFLRHEEHGAIALAPGKYKITRQREYTPSEIRNVGGVLHRKEIESDEPIVMVKVRNSTPEPDGSFKDYFLRVPPDVTTAREAVAWTFDMSPTQYLPIIET